MVTAKYTILFWKVFLELSKELCPTKPDIVNKKWYMKIEPKTENWYAILGTKMGIVSVHSRRAEANKEHKALKCTKKNRIVKCTVTYVD